MVMISGRFYSCSSLNGLEVFTVFWICSRKQSDIPKMSLGIRRDLPPGWLSHPSFRAVGFFCFIVRKIERKDTGVLLLFCVGVPGAGAGQDQAWLHPRARCLGKGDVGSVPVMPMALGAGLMMMMKSLCPTLVSAGGRQELEALKALGTACRGTWLHFFQQQGLFFRNWGTQAPGLAVFMAPAPVLTFFPTQCPQPRLLSRHLGALCVGRSGMCPHRNGARSFCHQKSCS